MLLKKIIIKKCNKKITDPVPVPLLKNGGE